MRTIDADALKEAINSTIAQATKIGIMADADYLWELLNYAIDNAPTVIVDNCGKCPYYKDHDRDIITEAYNDGYKTAKEEFENHKLVNNSQELVKELVKEKSEIPRGEWVIVDDTEKFIAKCSICGRIEDSRMVKYHPFCRCGADMRKDGAK